MKYRKKPVVIEAEHFTEENKDRAFNFVTCNCRAEFDADGKPQLMIQTREGDMTATLGDFIVKGVQGEFYPVKPDIFAATYESAEPQHDHERVDAAVRAVRLEGKCRKCRNVFAWTGDFLAGVLRAELAPKGIGVRFTDEPLLKLTLPGGNNGAQKKPL